MKTAHTPSSPNPENLPLASGRLLTSTRRALVLLSLVLSAVAAPAATLTWDADGVATSGALDGSGTWDDTTALWWNGSSDVTWTNADANSATFGSGGAGGRVTLATNITVANIKFNSVTTNYIITGNTLTLTNSPIITVAATSGGLSNVIESVLAGAAFTKEGPGMLALNPSANNTFTGTTILNAGWLNLAGSDATVYINGDLIVNAGATFGYANAGSGGPVLPTASLIVDGGTVNNYVNQKNFYINKLVIDNNALLRDGVGNSYMCPTNIDARSGRISYGRYRWGMTLAKSTAGTVIITNRPNTSATDGHIVTMNAGTLIFDKSSHNGFRLKTTSLLTLGGGSLIFSNGNSTISPSAENPSAGGTSLIPGASSLVAVNGGAGGGNITLGAITRSVGATFDVTKSGPGVLTTTTANNNGILGGWATFAGQDWLVGTTFTSYSAYETSADPTTWVATTNVSLSGNPSANLDDVTINSLRLTAASTVTLNSGKTLTLSSGGLLVTGSGPTAISDGTLLGASGQDLVVIQNSAGDLTISSALANNGSATALTKSGSGKLILTGANAMTGNNYLNGGVVEVDNLNKLASGSFVMNAGTLRYVGTDATETRAVTLRGLGGTFDVSGGTNLTFSGAITGSGAVLGDLGGLTKIGNGTLVLTASNYYNGATVVSAGTLLVNGTNAYDSTVYGAGKLNVNGGTLGGTGTFAGSVAIKSGATLSAGGSIGTLTVGSLTLEAGSTSLFEITNAPGTGDLVVVQGNLTVSNSTIAITVPGTALNPGTYPLFQYTGKLVGSFNPTVTLVGGSLDASMTIDTSTPGQVSLVMVPQPAITCQPADFVGSVGTNVVLTVCGTGTAPLSYQWYTYGNNTNNTPTPISTATNDTFSITNAQTTDSGYYSVVITNNSGAIASRIARVIVGDVAPVISGPVNQTVIQGNNATFNVTVDIANPYPDFQWRTNGVDVTGATGTSLTFNNVQFAMNGTVVSVVASNIAGMATNSATLTVIVTPVITPIPTNLTVNVGDTATFYSGATGEPAPALQWYKNGALMSGQTSSNLTIVNAQGSDIAIYTLVASNVAGVVTSPGAKLTVLSTTLAAVTLAPTNGATGVCYDTPLSITFNGAVTSVWSGKIRIYNVTNPTTPVDTIDMSSNNVFGVQARGLFPGDNQFFMYYPVMTSGSTAVLYPHPGVLTSNQTYYVTLEPGVLAESAGGAYFPGITATNTWQFTTKATGPANPTNLIVAADGSGDFVTVQGAVDSIPLNSTNFRVINIRDGNYVGLINISAKHNVTFRGQSRLGTVIGYPNNNNLNAGTHARMAFKVNANDIALERLTLANDTAQGGSQAEALMIETGARRCVVANVDINSRQDTILANVITSQGYFYDVMVRGNYDYVWGGGNVFFEKCTFYTLTNILSGTYNFAAPRTDYSTVSQPGTWPIPDGTKWSSNGMSFVECTLVADPGVGNISLAGANGNAGGLASWVFCKIDTNAYVSPASTLWNTYNFWQYENTDTNGNPVSFAGLQTLTNGDPRLVAVTNATVWLYGWTPSLAPNILTQPANQSVSGGGTASFTVVATGIPAPTYQWLKDGTNLLGETGATLTITNANANKAGAYAVVVTTPAASVTSSSATLTVGNTAPSLLPISDSTINAGATLTVGAVANDPDVPAQTLTFSLLSYPANASIGPNTGLFSWRPTVAQANTTNLVTIQVADNGSPVLTATQSFNVIVNPIIYPALSSTVSFIGGQFSLTVDSGTVGPDYVVLASADLLNWTPIYTNLSPAVPFTAVVDTNTVGIPTRFYRIQLAP